MQPLIDVHCTIGPDQDIPLDAEELLGMMDRHGIAKAILSPSHQQMAVGNAEGHDILLDLTRRHPDRLLGYASVNPWYGSRAAAELRRALAAGLAGVKFHPALQGFFAFDDGKMGPLLEIAAEYRVPVYIHTGTPVFALPLQVAELALRYPHIPFIMGRMGNTDFWIDTPKAYALADNLYVDTPYTAPVNIKRLLEIDAGRVLFSADLPYSHPGIERRKVEDIGLGEREFQGLARGNAERIFPGLSRKGESA